MLPLLSIAHALAGEPDDGVAAAVGVRVDMPAMHTVAPSGVWRQVPDAIAVETALATYRIGADDASVVTAQVDGEGARIHRLDLGDGAEQDLAARHAKHVCTRGVSSGLWNGGPEIRVFEARQGRAPGLVMVDGDPKIGALVALAPGDRVDVRDVRRDGVLMREVVRVQRAGGAFVVDRDELSERFCYAGG
jgi:hypothetical protein